jgi:hypothetical protein
MGDYHELAEQTIEQREIEHLRRQVMYWQKQAHELREAFLATKIQGFYGEWCRTPWKCHDKGRCPKIPACSE